MKDSMKLTMAMAAILLGLGVVSAEAQQRGEERGAMAFTDLDVDGSGEITVEDLTQARDNRFAEIDANGDGTVDRDEFLAHAQAKAAEHAGEKFDRLDADGDGALSRDVLEARGRGGRGIERMIDRFDSDNSGGVSEAEFEEARAGLRERHGGRKGFGRRH